MRPFGSWIFALVLMHVALFAHSQDCRTATHIFWQPGTALQADDFQKTGGVSEKELLHCDSLGLCTMAYLGLWYQLDVPKRKRDRGRLLEKVYILPAFQTGTSYRIGDVPSGVAEQQVVFDIFELAARAARAELKGLHDTLPGYGVDYISLETVMADAKKMRDAMVAAFTRQVYLNKEAGAYERWREQLDSALEGSTEFATRPEDCQRFKQGTPLLENYISSSTLMRAMPWTKD